jgi:apolipoprotein N-acyltransferase
MQDNILTKTVFTNKKELANKIKLILSNIALSILSGLLLSYAYPPYNFSFLAFFAIIILLIINELACKINLKLRYTFLLFWLSGVITNIIVTHWLYHTVIIPVLLIHCINPIFIAFVLTVYSKV